MPGLVRGPNPGGLFPVFLKTLLLVALFCGSDASGSEYEYVSQPRFLCTPIPADADPGCFPMAAGPLGSSTGAPGGGHHSGGHGSSGGGSGGGWWGLPEEAKATILHLRESLVQQKETILNQRDKIRELTSKLALCEGFGRGMGHHDLGPSPHLTHHTLPYPESSHHGDPEEHYPSMGLGGHHRTAALGEKHGSEMTPSSSSSPDQLERMLHALKERLESLQVRAGDNQSHTTNHTQPVIGGNTHMTSQTRELMCLI